MSGGGRKYHEGIVCNACSSENFHGRRYKCLICHDFDMCEKCHERARRGILTLPHLPDHAVQCVLTPWEQAICFGVVDGYGPVDSFDSYTCPYCRKMGYSSADLFQHVMDDHKNVTTIVICPICVIKAANGDEAVDPNRRHYKFFEHLYNEHVNFRSDNGEELLFEECSGVDSDENENENDEAFSEEDKESNTTDGDKLPQATIDHPIEPRIEAREKSEMISWAQFEANLYATVNRNKAAREAAERKAEAETQQRYQQHQQYLQQQRYQDNIGLGRGRGRATIRYTPMDVQVLNGPTFRLIGGDHPSRRLVDPQASATTVHGGSRTNNNNATGSASRADNNNTVGGASRSDNNNTDTTNADRLRRQQQITEAFYSEMLSDLNLKSGLHALSCLSDSHAISESHSPRMGFPHRFDSAPSTVSRGDGFAEYWNDERALLPPLLKPISEGWKFDLDTARAEDSGGSNELKAELTEEKKIELDVERANRALFVQELLMSMMAENKQPDAEDGNRVGGVSGGIATSDDDFANKLSQISEALGIASLKNDDSEYFDAFVVFNETSGGSGSGDKSASAQDVNSSVLKGDDEIGNPVHDGAGGGDGETGDAQSGAPTCWPLH